MCSFNEVLNAAQVIALVPITGGTVAIGALVAPQMFKVLDRPDAAKLMIAIFGNFDKWIKTSASLLLTSKLIQLIFIDKLNFYLLMQTGEELTKKLNTTLVISTLLVFAIAAVSFHIAFRLSPKILQAYNTQSDTFDKLHKENELLHKINFLFGIVLLLTFV